MAIVWVVLGVGLLVAEMFTGTFVLAMFAVGALASAAAAGLGAGAVTQLVVFAAVSAVSMLGVRPLLRRYLHRGQAVTPGLGLEAIEGSSAVVLEKVDADAGLIKVEGEIWSARAYDGTQVIEAGERVHIVEIKGATALVWRD